EIADGYLESQAAGEEILLTGDRSAWDGPDFWLFDAGPDGRAHAVLQHYDARGAPVGFEPITERPRVAELEAAAQALITSATPLNRWLVEHREDLRGAGIHG